MHHRDAYLSDVKIVTRSTSREHTEQIAIELKSHGLEIDEINHDQGVIEGTVDASKVETIRLREDISYVRVEMSYIADYPTGDPRDLDGTPVD